ncbi:MAG: hypothetical protein ABIR71_14410 [Chthoniobacterales bacterium]
MVEVAAFTHIASHSQVALFGLKNIYADPAKDRRHKKSGRSRDRFFVG